MFAERAFGRKHPRSAARGAPRIPSGSVTPRVHSGPVRPSPVPRPRPSLRSFGARPPVTPRSATVYRRRRWAALGLLGAVVVLVGLAVGAARGPVAAADRPVTGRSAADTGDGVAPARTVTYVVQPGDTLWAIARRLAPGTDPRPLVDELKRDAGGAVLRVGQRLEIPADLVHP